MRLLHETRGLLSSMEVNATTAASSSGQFLLNSLHVNSTASLALSILFAVLFGLMLLFAPAMAFKQRSISKLAVVHLMIALFCGEILCPALFPAGAFTVVFPFLFRCLQISDIVNAACSAQACPMPWSPP